MRLQPSKNFEKEYARLPRQIQERTDKQLALLLSNPHHPSLQTEKAKGYRDIWKGRITQDYRFTFQIIGDTYILRRIGPHDMERNP